MSENIYTTAHLVAKQAVDEVDLISSLAWFGGDPEIKVADSCIQLLFKCQILGTHTLYIRHHNWQHNPTHLLLCERHIHQKSAQNMSFQMWSINCLAPQMVGFRHGTDLNSVPGSWTTSPWLSWPRRWTWWPGTSQMASDRGPQEHSRPPSR